VKALRSNFDLVIFDCDGVLVDSEVISCRAHAEALTRHGYPITSDQVLGRRASGRHDRIRVLRRQRLPAWSRPDAAYHRPHQDFRPHAAIAGFDRANRSNVRLGRWIFAALAYI
jgi:beta-phosphoglucomutase-like phosphatase (HAD superfamily)